MSVAKGFAASARDFADDLNSLAWDEAPFLGTAGVPNCVIDALTGEGAWGGWMVDERLLFKAIGVRRAWWGRNVILWYGGD